VILGARDPKNRLHLDTDVPRAYFGTGSETNFYLKTEIAEFRKADDPSVRIQAPVFSEERGCVRLLCESSKLCDTLENVDFYIRNVNLQDEDITAENKDVNVFMASLMYMTKHVQAGLTSVEKLDDVLKIGEMVAGGADAFRENPVLSFITCLVKSPLQMVDDTTEKLIEIAKRGAPVVISSSPQGGSTAPIREEGMVGLINAEILAGITLAQTVNPGTPLLYGAVPVRARLDTLHDQYGAPEFIHYNVDCVQMARFYGIPCYSTAGVGDGKYPGMHSLVEKLYAYLGVASSGAQYIHYALGLMDKTNVFCPLQAVLDDAHIGIVREILRRPVFDASSGPKVVKEVRKVMNSSTKLFARYIRKAIREGLVSEPYAFESPEGRDEVLPRAADRLAEILAGPGRTLEDSMFERIREAVPGVLPQDRFRI
jgi:trimethylamine--corrinoid protein Co-methyltransferase